MPVTKREGKGQGGSSITLTAGATVS